LLFGTYDTHLENELDYAIINFITFTKPAIVHISG